MKLSHNTIFITGGGSGIGLALAKAFLELDNTVIICGRNPDKLAQVKHHYPAIHTLPCDITLVGDVERALAILKADFHGLDVLVNNAGTLHPVDFERDDDGLQKIEAEIETNLTAPIKLTRLLLPLLRQKREAAIINVSSGLAYAPMASTAVYCATKAALHSWTRSLRYQLERTSVKVFELLPPTVATEMTRDFAVSKISPEMVARETMASLKRDNYEIRVGQTKALYVLSRLSPALAEGILRKA